jgi:L-ascorbate oxidase
MRWTAGLLAACLATGATAKIAFSSKTAVVHDNTWEPEYVLVATAQNITTNCHSRYSVVFNETSPGPALYMKEGKTTWVRVYNKVEDKNLTVVGSSYFSRSIIYTSS